VVIRIDKTAKAFAAIVATAGVLAYAGAPTKSLPGICAGGASGPAQLYAIFQACGWPKVLPIQVQRSLGEYMATGVDPLSRPPVSRQPAPGSAVGPIIPLLPRLVAS
jgi:hypothetical protein